MTAESNSKSMFSFIRNFQIVFPSGRTILHFHQQWEFIATPHPHQHLVVSVFWVLAALTGVLWNIIVILIFISLITCDVEHFFHVFIYYLYIFFGEVSVQVFGPFFN